MKGLLINKFKVKYGDKGPGLAKYIDNEVQKFLKNDRLTEDNLKKLDDRIFKESELRDRKDGILDDRRSQKSAGPGGRSLSQKAPEMDARSVASSKMSGASGISRGSKAAPAGGKNVGKKDFDTYSIRSGSQGAKTEVYSELDENDEWTAIQKFNTLLHYEEQKQALMRDRERKRLIKEELDKQLKEKNSRKRAEVEERRLYENLQEQHVKLLEEKEVEKAAELKRRIVQEKMSRDKQLMDEKQRKRVEDKETYKQEVALVNRLQDEMEAERRLQQEKRKQEKEYLQKMLVENEKHKAKALAEREKERLEDIRAQEEYARMLDKQEQDRLNEVKAREQRAQEFMNRMADTVIKNMDNRARQEEEKIKKYELEKELRERMADEQKMNKVKQEQQRMRDYLARQMEEKKRREGAEKALNDEQACMWSQDFKNYSEEERRLHEKVNKINRDNQDFLRRQMEEKQAKVGVKTKMNKQEFLLNKPLLKEINDKKRTTGYGNFGGSPSKYDEKSMAAGI